MAAARGVLVAGVRALGATQARHRELVVGWQVVNVVVLHAGNTIINPNGIFVYDGAPAAGNLIIALAPAAGTDQFANAFIKGILIGEPTDSAQIQLVPGGGGPAKLLVPLPPLSLSHIAHGPARTSGAAGTLIFSGAALATVGQRDLGQDLPLSYQAGRPNSPLEFRYISATGVVAGI